MFYDMERSVDELGRVVLPIELRSKLQIQTKSKVRMYIQDDKLILQKVDINCVQCGSTEDLLMLHDRTLICKSCVCQLADRVREEAEEVQAEQEARMRTDEEEERES